MTRKMTDREIRAEMESLRAELRKEWSEGAFHRLNALADELIRREV